MTEVETADSAAEILLPGGNSVELLGTYGSDKTHALSAWTSTARELTKEKEERIPELLKYLASNQHETPFEKSTIHFLIKVETATHIQILKHRIAVSLNGESARYKELQDDKFFIPPDWPPEYAKYFEEKIKDLYKEYHFALKYLEKNIGRTRAKESARFWLPYANQLYLDVSFNFRSFMHFQLLRNDRDHAQKEVNDIAEAMLTLVRNTNLFNESLKGFGYATS